MFFMVINGKRLKVEHSKCDFLEFFVCFLHRLILWNVFFKMTHVLPLISAQNGDKNALQNRRDSPVLNQFGYLTIVFSMLSFSQNLPMYSILPCNIYKSIKDRGLSLCILAAL